jgi:uncharacterized protein YjbJ (UPF0337 family)
MDTDRIKGATRELYGRGEEAVGALMGDKETRARGALDQVAGKAQGAMGRAGEAIRETVSETMESGRELFRRHEGHGREGIMRTPPLGALLIAASAGFALAWMLHARER